MQLDSIDMLFREYRGTDLMAARVFSQSQRGISFGGRYGLLETSVAKWNEWKLFETIEVEKSEKLWIAFEEMKRTVMPVEQPSSSCLHLQMLIIR